MQIGDYNVSSTAEANLIARLIGPSPFSAKTLFTVQYAPYSSKVAESISFRDRDSARRFADACVAAGYTRVKIYRRVH